MKWTSGIVVGAFAACSAVMVAGVQHWETKIEGQAQAAVVETAQPHQKQFSGVSSYTKHLPPFLVSAIEDTFIKDKPISLVLVAREEDEWASFVKKSLEDTYGQDVFHIQIYSYHDQTTKELVHSSFQQDLQKLNPTLVLAEVPMLEDLNTMHRYRDAILNSKNERIIEKAIVLFPSNDKTSVDYFLKSIEKIGIGALPFLPTNEKIVQDFILGLLTKFN